MRKQDPHIPVENGKYFLCQTEDTSKVLEFIGTVIAGSDGSYYQVTMATFERNTIARIWYARGRRINEAAYRKALAVQTLKRSLLTARLFACVSWDDMPTERNRTAAAEVSQITAALAAINQKLVSKVMPTVRKA